MSAAAALAVAALAGCSSGSSDSGDGKVTLTWWHNGNRRPAARASGQDVADGVREGAPERHRQGHRLPERRPAAHPHPERAALGQPAGPVPGLGRRRAQGPGRGRLRQGHLRRRQATSSTPSARPRAVGRSTARPTDCRSATASRASGTTRTSSRRPASPTPPTTLDELNDDVAKLKAAGIAPIAVGAGDKWPAAHWWYNFALKDCSPDVLKRRSRSTTSATSASSRPATTSRTFIDTNPFQEGFLATPAQQGAGSSAGLVANGKAAMELMGHWDPGVMGGLDRRQEGPAVPRLVQLPRHRRSRR